MQRKLKESAEKKSSYPRRPTSGLMKFPEQILIQVDRMILCRGPGRRGYVEITDWLKNQGYQTSKSAVGRYAKYLFAQGRTKESVLRRMGSGRLGRFYELIDELLDLFEQRQT